MLLISCWLGAKNREDDKSGAEVRYGSPLKFSSAVFQQDRVSGLIINDLAACGAVLQF